MTKEEISLFLQKNLNCIGVKSDALNYENYFTIGSETITIQFYCKK